MFSGRFSRFSTVNPVLSGHTKEDKIKDFKDWLSFNAGQKYCRMLRGSILQYCRPALSYLLCLRPSFYLFLNGRLKQVWLYFGIVCGHVKNVIIVLFISGWDGLLGLQIQNMSDIKLGRGCCYFRINVAQIHPSFIFFCLINKSFFQPPHLNCKASLWGEPMPNSMVSKIWTPPSHKKKNKKNSTYLPYFSFLARLYKVQVELL